MPISVGLLTLMYIDSLIVLARPWSSLLIIVKFSELVLCPAWVLCAWMDEGSFMWFGERYKEHLKEPSSIHAHSTQAGHSTNSENLSIIRREDHRPARTIKESIYIRVNNPTLNRNVGKYNIHHTWDIVPYMMNVNTPDLK